jgi:hypothetical protein
MKCQCETLTELEGNEAEDYEREHLQKVRVDVVAWEKEYLCPVTGIQWLEDRPFGYLQAGGPPRLRRLPIAPDQPE